MVVGVQIHAFDNSWSQPLQVDRLPDECPICRMGVLPIFRAGVSNGVIQGGSPPERAELAVNCTRKGCGALFVARYELESKSTTGLRLALKECVPMTPKKTEFPEEIRSLSPGFVEILNQAEAAEAVGLDQMVGMGYRKALEFLVKDFAKSEHPAEKEAIEKKMLGPCIKEYIDDTNVKKVAERAAWLGNDETHYVRRWETKDVEDLKRLVGLTVRAIENVLVTQLYLKEMPDGGPKAGP